MFRQLKRVYHDTIFQDIVRGVRGQQQVRHWEDQGRPSKVPHILKERVVQAAARRYGLNTLVETGTFRGDMIHACRRHFQQIYSIELDANLHAQAQRRFAGQPAIALLQGDSEQMLPMVLERLNEPALFWLDAHYSGGVTARGPIDTPIVRELRAVLSHHMRGHVVLIDDAHEFVGRNDYPTLEEVGAAVANLRPEYSVAANDNIIRIAGKD